MASWRWWWLPTNHMQQGSVWIALLILMQRKKNQETWTIWLNDELRERRFAMAASQDSKHRQNNDRNCSANCRRCYRIVQMFGRKNVHWSQKPKSDLPFHAPLHWTALIAIWQHHLAAESSIPFNSTNLMVVLIFMIFKHVWKFAGLVLFAQSFTLLMVVDNNLILSPKQ